jgi:DNA-binding NtrC family response regulator
MKPSLGRVLVVDDEEDFCRVLFLLLKAEGFDPIVANEGEKALAMIEQGLPDAVLVDVQMPGIDGMQVLKRLKKTQSDLPVIVMSAYGGVIGAVEAIKEGAFDYLQKPLDNAILVEKLRRAVWRTRPLKGTASNSVEATSPSILSLSEIMGPSESISKVISDVRLVAPSDFTVIIQGESGTGKELIARSIHQASLRAKGTVISLDCGAIPETLFESELFGYEKGAFTGANTQRAGKFEMAQRGTLFLDEIGNMPRNCQTKLLRAIQERTFFRVGGAKPVNVDVRLVVATNQDLVTKVSGGSFSRDLFYRLSEFTILIPPLRDRKEDIIHLAKRFLRATNMELNKKVRHFSHAALEILVEYPWPGNVRQLRSAVRRAVLQADNVIGPEHLSVEGTKQEIDTGVGPNPVDWAFNGLSLKEIVRRSVIDVERGVLAQVLRKTKGNKAEAARLLQIDYKTIHTKIKQYRITIHREGSDGQEN